MYSIQYSFYIPVIVSLSCELPVSLVNDSNSCSAVVSNLLSCKTNYKIQYKEENSLCQITYLPIALDKNYTSIFLLFDLEFYSPFNTFKVMSSQ